MAYANHTQRGQTIPPQLVNDWWALWHRCPNATPFQSPAWLVPWWHAFAPGELEIVCIYRDEQLVGLAPFYIEQNREGRKALPIGIAISDYLDVLIDAELFDAVAPLLGRQISENLAPLSHWEFAELAPWASALRLPICDNVDQESSASSLCSTLSIPAEAQTPREFIPPHRLKAMRTACNRMRRSDDFQIVEANSGNVAELFDSLMALHGDRWQRRGSSGVLIDPDVTRFHRAALPALADADLLRLYGLRFQDRYIGIHYGLHHRTRSYSYLTGFDVRFQALSPGNVLLAHAVERAHANGALEFDFLRGNEQYKHLWGGRDRENQRRVLRPRRTHYAMRAAGRH